MVAIEADAEQDMKSREFDPLTTPYEVDGIPFPEEESRRVQFKHLLRYAVLAPSSHNTQPWNFSLFDNGIAIFADYTRRLPVSDPNNRELLMGVGAALMNLRIAARHFGFACKVDYNVSGETEKPVAFATLTPVQQRKPSEDSVERLFYSITKRHTNRRPFLMARVPDSLLMRLSDIGADTGASVYISTDPKRNTDVARIVANAERLQQADPAFRKELGEWLRPNKTQKADGITGAALGLSDVGSTLAPWAVKTIDMGGIRARHDERLCIEAPALCVLYSEESIPSWLAVGETLQKILLTLTRDGLQVSYFNMPIEIAEARIQLREMLSLSSWPQLLLRIGYSLEKPSASPRRAVEDCIG